MTSRIACFIIFFFVFAANAFAAGGGEHHGVPSEARSLFPAQSLLAVITNSLFAAAIVTALILWFCRSAMRNATLIPGKKQNFVEMVIEFLYNQVENIVGPKVTPKAFPLLATIFVFVTVANWCGLLPGVGTIGFNEHQDGWAASHFERPLLRPATADMNMTLGIAIISFIIWFYCTIREIGFFGFLNHTFGPKGGLVGAMKWGLMPIFLIVGVIEVISILFRPMTLSLRLYGNVFAGENLLHTMGALVQTKIPVIDWFCSVLLQLPFYFLEILVGVLQGMVFALLNAVFIKLSTTHEEGHEEAHH
jgi:F-type H+-transporting ATPase subunit a